MSEPVEERDQAHATRGPDVPPDAPASETAAERGLPHEHVSFAHNSERQFAQLLDFYGVEWQYEPHTFVLARDVEGQPTFAFSPDFYLPAYDLYIEITTMRQKLVTRKNRKLRLLGEQHPDVRIKLLYQRDYLHLLVKYGLESPDQLDDWDTAATAAESGDTLLLLGLDDGS